MTPRQAALRRTSRFLLAVAVVALLSACDDRATTLSGRSLAPIPRDTLALMQSKGVSQDAPILLRSYKQEAELEIWKQKPDGRYVYLKTFPMCRWSGQLGPKMREGDRQVPEGFYSITPGQMNPNSHYYLSFNVGYPNAYDRARGYTGGDIMVHGICSSAGCFSMTNDQIAEIYAIAREAFNGGQKAIQLQSLPFKMTAENLAKHRFDPNIAFWKMLKEGADNFEVTKMEPQVGVCAKRYVFNASAASGERLDPSAACPPLVGDDDIKAEVAAKQQRDDAEVAAFVAKGVPAVKLVYADGGMNPAFANKPIEDVSRPDALTSGPVEIALDERGRPLKPAAVQVLAAKSRPAATVAVAKATTEPGPVLASLGPAAPQVAEADQPFYKRWLGFGSDSTNATAVAANEPAAPEPADVPLPPRRPGVASVVTATAASPASQDADPATTATVAPQPPAPEPAAADQPFYKRWLGLAPDAPPPAQAAQPEAPQPADVPLPPRRRAHAAAPIKPQPQPQASLPPAGSPFGGLQNATADSNPALPQGFMALAPVER